MRLAWTIGLGAALCSVAVQAETLPVAGVYAAGTDAPSRARSIAIGDFSGRGGERLAFAIDSALRGAVIDGEPWFALTFTAPAFGDSYTYDGGTGSRAPGRDGGPDAVMRGIAEVTWRDVDSGTKEVEECVARANGQCTERKKVTYPCRAREVTLRPEVRLVARGGELLYAKGDTRVLGSRFCKDEERTPAVDSMVEELARGFAGDVRHDLAPEFRAEDIRVLETREGVAKPDHNAFKAAIRLTKSDVAGACRAFSALEAANPSAVSLVFNIGLCREGEGDLASAEAHYREVLALKPGKIEAVQGLERIVSRRRAETQRDLRAGR
ncbi:hypothetical protein ACLBKU_16325 [Erythrobacter sp. NE805]|uniref:hypothetical protein n=1 Tax=Erythrobacter sp. NE805 TaxID=3389875 RepID=UPI00396AFF34